MGRPWPKKPSPESAKEPDGLHVWLLRYLEWLRVRQYSERTVVNRDAGRLFHRTAAAGWDWVVCEPASRPPVGAATRVSSVASGRQQNRSGANGDVPIPADT